MDDQVMMYRVEVSGWDLKEQFFVERTALQWGEGDQRSVLIRQRVRQGALVFIRLLEAAAPSRCFPVAYRARQIMERENGALYELSLSQVWPTEDSPSTGANLVLDTTRGRAAGLN
ncbi:MAG TPA: hypothetical protein VEG63_02210 [Candidatus Acidoferrales bacterium]|nr:hypothetical protein [Candidatus Acidoferrales bacterium]